MKAAGAGEVGFSTSIAAVCSFKHLWEKKMAFSYCFFSLLRLMSAGAASAGLWDVSKRFWVVSPKGRPAAGKSITAAARPQPGTSGRLVTPRLVSAAIAVGVLGSAAAPQAHTLTPGQQPARRAGTFLSLVVMDEAFLILPLSSGLEHRGGGVTLFLTPLCLVPSDTQHHILPSSSVPGHQR